MKKNDFIMEVGHERLLWLKNRGLLKDGQMYCIVDYQFSSNSYWSAGHGFDILVTAVSNSELSEEAYARRHKGDTYFSNCRLNGWKLRYCIDNDTNRFAWANSSGKGVIYYMRDEYFNEAGYDFKNALLNITIEGTSHQYFTFSDAVGSDYLDRTVSENCVTSNNKIGICFDNGKQCINNISFLYNNTTAYCGSFFINGCSGPLLIEDFDAHAQCEFNRNAEGHIVYSWRSTATNIVSREYSSGNKITMPKLATPVVTSGGITDEGFQISWDAVDNATLYKISTDNGSTWEDAVSPKSFSDLNPYQLYKIKVKALAAYNGYKESDAGSLDVTTSKSKLSTPSNISSSNIADTSFDISWDAVENAHGYKVSIDDGITWTESETTSLSVTGLSASTAYSVKVKAIALSDSIYTDSDPSSTQTITTTE